MKALIWPKHVAVNILYSNVVFTNYSLISLAEDTVGIIRFKICRCADTQAFKIATVIAEYINRFDINPQVVARNTKIRHAISSMDELAFVTLLCLSAPHKQNRDGYIHTYIHTHTHTHTHTPKVRSVNEFKG